MTKAVGSAWITKMLAAGWVSADVDAYLLDQASSFDPTVDLLLADILADVVAGPVAVTGKTSDDDGYWDGDNVFFTVADGDEAAWFVLVESDGVDDPIIGSTNQRADNSPLAIVGNGGLVEMQVQDIGFGRI